MKIIERKTFRKSLEKSDIFIKKKVRDTLILFFQDPFDNKLHNHPLQGTKYGQRTINVTWDRRIIFKELSDGKYELVELIDIWTHSQLYK